MCPKSNHVLVVDDDPDVAEQLAFVLERAGFTVTVAGDGEEALRLARWQPPDLITLDGQMPRKSGPETYRELRADLLLCHVPVVVISGLAGDGGRRLFEVDGVPPPSAYLDKPIDGVRLVKVLRELLPA